MALPPGLPAAFTDPVPDPLGDLVARFARTHGPFVTTQVAGRYGAPTDRVLAVLERLEAEGRVVRGEFRPDGIEREWVDDDVLRQLRRRSLAALRHEVEPVEAEALARFLPAWQNVGPTRRGLDALVDALGVLQGAPISASVLEADVLAARVLGYRPTDLDALMTAGDVVWVGAGAVGTGDGRVRLVFRDQAGLLVPLPDPEVVAALVGRPADGTDGAAPDDGASGDPARDVRRAIHTHLSQRGASFWPELVAASQAADQPYDDATVLAALWELVWAGLVTNDSLAALRAMVASGGRRKAAGAGATRRSGRRAGGRVVGRRPNLGRPSMGSLNRLGPPAAAGRWSLVEPLLSPSPTPTEVAHATALQLLERHGVLTREAVLGEGVEGGFAAVYPVLKALEERGQVRRGYFVAGLGAAQFALPGAVDRLRAAREVGDDDLTPVVLAATDPAQPFGATLPWPDSAGRPARAAGAFVVLLGGEAAVFVERGGRSLASFPAAHRHAHWAEGLASLVKDGRLRRLEITKIDGAPAVESPLADVLRTVGFADGYRGLTLGGR